jgi:hypothetical protein
MLSYPAPVNVWCDGDSYARATLISTFDAKFVHFIVGPLLFWAEFGQGPGQSAALREGSL